ncbi:nitrogen fixation protein NifQ [Rivihabitans pingtungensis]|jgi:nitrogen fixation protein NifQ|uniref:Nitrogen fixation protein NifQ n=2 Tax=Rivihabitans pingtungensis TaxID=1054498 RepID=A0A318KRU7_9NEIS|nr:nitrogen fixation protein NifQ [Rivihabitans pingtungensis]PXX79528.1 nitrogen fixation protein NifQ [Rivihabitans pingtungensis]
MIPPDRLHHRALLCASLLQGDAGPAPVDEGNRSLLASLLAGQRAGLGCLPPQLGLADNDFAAMLAAYFPTARLPAPWPAASPERVPEWDELVQFLLDHRAGEQAEPRWMAQILAAACAGRDHLWQDLGLTGRHELSQLIALNFPALAQANDGDMKWKKFIYRQLCAREGIYVCPAPSCQACHDRPACFGPES